MLFHKLEASFKYFVNSLSDVSAFYISFVCAYLIRKILYLAFPHIFPPFEHAIHDYIFYFPFLIIYFFILNLFGLTFKKRFFWEDVREYIKAISLYSILVLAFLSISRQIYEFSRTVLIFHILLLVILAPALKYFINVYIISKFFPSFVGYIGPDESFKDFFKQFLTDKYLGFYLTKPDEAEYIFISDKLKNYQEIFLIFQKRKRKVFILEERKVSPPLSYTLHLKIGGNIIALEYENKLLNSTNLVIKRFIDYSLSIMLLPVLIMLILIIAILIKLDSKGPVFYYHERVGKGGKKFKCIKFRTMVVDAEKKLKEIIEKDPEKKREWETFGKFIDDPRITRVGKFLRKTSLDELPQIINVLKGDMSLVGPRPVTEEELEKHYGKLKDYYLSVYPGITGLWQVSGRNKLSYKERVYLDVWYVLNWSIWLDFVILIKTLKEIIKPSGI